ncbi:Glycosyltransferase involved in cell wall bisynthesis [Sinomicrobium oceani]|uniref:Glycosyltransferase involved in cell wall bisynthesis n=1 Tax=Sinomicrobium oceani TaxID=1150368 RepID=A0A1K1QZN3_9FLAO|nr:glycosyltransferase family 4 protein [Sinomicrobium oceani]SFW65237.1 Glycosyltransferase involved in cell wall bisynthesis [Sinomicrobium oceani]
MRILLIKQLFNPEPTAKSLDFALELKKRGHEVQVLTGFPSYPLGEIYEGYKQKLWKREVMEGIEVIRVPIYPNQSDNGMKRMLHYLSYAFSASLFGPFLVKRPDVAFVYQGAIPVGIPATVFKWFRGIPFVYDINDLWPETVAVSGMMKNKRLLKLINAWCDFNYRRASKITVATPGFKQRLIEKGVPESKISFVPNWSRDKYSTAGLDEELKENYFPGDKFHVLYAGNLGVVQALDIVLEVAQQLKQEGNSNIQFTLLGGGADEARLKNKRKQMELDNVQFIERVDGGEVTKYLNSADALLVHLKNTDLFEITIPSKILSYLRTGKPILMGLKGNAAEIIKTSGAGFLFEPQDADDLKQKLDELYHLSRDERKNMGKKGIEYYDNNLSIVASTEKLEKAFFEILKQ